MPSYFYDTDTAPPVHDMKISSQLKEIVAERVAGGEAVAEVVEELILQLAGLRVQYAADVYEAATAAKEAVEEDADRESVDEETSESNEDFFARMSRDSQRYQLARAGVEQDAARIVREVDTEGADRRKVASTAMRAALNHLRSEALVHESARLEMDSLADELLSASSLSITGSGTDHVVWRMPRDIHAVLQARSGRYTHGILERPMTAGVAFASLQEDVAAWLGQIKDDRSYTDIYCEEMSDQGLKGEDWFQYLQAMYPSVPRDLVGLVTERTLQGFTDTPLRVILTGVQDLLAIAWVRDTD